MSAQQISVPLQCRGRDRYRARERAPRHRIAGRERISRCTYKRAQASAKATDKDESCRRTSAGESRNHDSAGGQGRNKPFIFAVSAR